MSQIEITPTRLADGKPSSFVQWVITKQLTEDGSIVVLPVCDAEEEGHFKPLTQAFSLTRDEAIQIAIHLLKLTDDPTDE